MSHRSAGYRSHYETTCGKTTRKLRRSDIYFWSEFCETVSKLFLSIVFSFKAIPVTTFGLGCWQLQRKTWKEGLIAQMESKLHLSPQPLPEDLSHLEAMEYQTVAVTGHFFHDKEMVLGPRGLIKPNGEESGGGLISQQNTSGYLIITPFKLDDREETILINRGWVSRQQLKPETRQRGQIEGTVKITGVVRLPEPRPKFTPSHQSEMFLYRDVPRMCSVTGADPIFLDAKEESTFPGGPIGGQTRVTLRNEHLSYVFTWYSLSAFTAFLWWKQILRKVAL